MQDSSISQNASVAQDASVSQNVLLPVSILPTSTVTPAVQIERTGVRWEDLENLAFEVDGESIQLEGGKAEIFYDGASRDRYVLQNRVAQGDLDDDGFEDVVAHVTMNPAGSGVFHLLVPVLDDGRGGVAKPPVLVGDPNRDAGHRSARRSGEGVVARSQAGRAFYRDLPASDTRDRRIWA